MQQITANVFVETGFAGCNVSLVRTSAGVVLIDTPVLPSNAVKWREAALARGPIAYLINTEPHPDHAFGNYFFPEATVVGHAGNVPLMPAAKEGWHSALEWIDREDPAGFDLIRDYVSRPPTVTFTETLTLPVGGHSFHLVNLPGHTREQTAVVVPEEGVVFTGDNVIAHNNPWLHQADPWVWLDSLEKIAHLKARLIVPGHGEVCDKSRLPEMTVLIREWIEAVRDAMRRGLTRDEAIATISFLDRYPVPPARVERIRGSERRNVANIWDRLLAREQSFPI